MRVFHLISKIKGAVVTSAKRALLYLLLSKGYAMCQRVYLLSRIFDLLFVVLKRAYFPRIAVSHKCFMVSGIL